MATEEYQVGYEAGYQDGFNAAQQPQANSLESGGIKTVEIDGIKTAQQPQADSIPVAAFDRLMALCESQAQRIIELEDKQPQPRAAPGYVLVPAKPTPEMWHAWDKSPFNEDGDIERNAAWSAMLKAAPQQAEPHKPLFADMIAQHPGLREELKAMDDPSHPLFVQQPQAEPDWVNGVPHWSPALIAKVKQMTAELDEPKQPQAEAVPPTHVLVPVEQFNACKEAFNGYSQAPTDYHRAVLKMKAAFGNLIDAALAAAPKGQP